MIFPDGGAPGGLETESELGASADGTVQGPAREGTHVVHGAREGSRLGSGALQLLDSPHLDGPALLVGAPGDDLGGEGAGSLTLHAVSWEADARYGGSSELLIGGAGSSFGCGALELGRDGLIAAGACTRSAEAGEHLGAVYLFDAADVQAGGIAWERAEGRVEGAVENGGFGASIATGDFDGDGLTDLVLGAPAAEGGRGQIYMVENIEDAPWRDVSDAPPLARGSAGDDALGTSILLDGDLTGDGHEDLIVCAPGWDIAGVPGAGACGVIPGGEPSDVLQDLDERVSSIVYGSRVGDAAGEGHMGVQVGPFLGDGGLALAVALPGADDSSGSVLIIGPDDLDGYVSATAATLRIDGDGRFGHSMATLPGGGLLIGAPEFGQGGAAFALLPDEVWMPAGESVHASDVAQGTYLGMSPDSAFGTTVAGGHDLDLDGWPDIAVGAPGPSEASPGSVLVAPIPSGWPVSAGPHFE